MFDKSEAVLSGSNEQLLLFHKKNIPTVFQIYKSKREERKGNNTHFSSRLPF